MSVVTEQRRGNVPHDVTRIQKENDTHTLRLFSRVVQTVYVFSSNRVLHSGAHKSPARNIVDEFRAQMSSVSLGWLPWAKVRAWGMRMPAVAHQRHKSVAYEVDLEQKQRNPVKYSQCFCFVKPRYPCHVV